MKKPLALAAILALVLAACGDGGGSGNGNGNGNETSLTINNLSDYALVSVEFYGVDFGSIRSGKDVTETVNAGTKYIYFVLQSADSGMVRCRTGAETCEENKKNEIVITNNTIITITASEKTDTLKNICTELSVTAQFYDIGDTGPGGGIVFFAESGQYKECSGELGNYNRTDALKTASNFKGGGFTDWRLPDGGELELMYENLHKNGLGGFSKSGYWSSFYSPISYLDFSNGKWNPDFHNPHRVRAVRAFSNYIGE